MEFSTYVQSVTQNRLAPKVKDTVLKGSVIGMRFLQNAKPWSGRKMEMAVKVAKSGTGGSFSGLDSFPVTLPNNQQKLAFDSRAYYQTASVAGLDMDIVNADPNAAVDYAVLAMESAQDDMADSVADLLYADGTGNSNKDFLGLKAIIDDGTYASTYGGLSRSTYTTLKSPVYTPAGALTSFTTLGTAISAARAGTDKISFIVTSDTKFNEAETLIMPTMQTTLGAEGRGQMTRYGVVSLKDGNKGEQGFESIYFRGVPIVADQKCPTLQMYGINERHLAWCGVKSAMPGYKEVKIAGDKQIDGVYSDEPGKNAGFFWSGWEFTPTQYGITGKLILHGNLMSGNPGRHFRIIFGA